jgi:hypothetical protein
MFYVFDYYYHCREEEWPMTLDPVPDSEVQIDGKLNFLFLIAVLLLLLMSGIWKPGMMWVFWGVELEL